MPAMRLCDTVRVTNRGPEDDVEFMVVNSELLEQFTSQLLGSFALKISVLLDFLPQTVRNAFKKAFPGNEASTDSTNVI